MDELNGLANEGANLNIMDEYKAKVTTELNTLLIFHGVVGM